MNHFSVHQKLTQHCKSTILQLKKRKKERKTERKRKKEKERKER